jgi:hypothetical protein
MTQSNFTDEGLPIGQNNVNMTYLYGLSDFFTIMFQDTSTVNLMLETTTQSASEIYSQFLQLTSTLSLENIAETVGSAITLVLVNSTATVAGQTNTFKLSETILSSKYVANAPFLPTSLLESGVDFGLTTATDGTTTITFAQAITSYAFPIQTLPDGSTNYALWFVDAAIDERLIAKYYGNLIGVTPANSTDAFYNFVYGLFYVYVQGPTLDVMSKGLNLALGIPLARAAETVLDIRQYLTTDQYIVITNANSYLIPYGLPPSVSIGDTLAVGDELANWVVIQDYQSNGDWWINMQIPPTIIPSLPDGQKDRYATAGSHFDYLMKNYLKKHTFLVNVNVSNFENIQQFAQLSSIIGRAKPAYTQPIYVWTIENLIETMTLTEEEFISTVQPERCEPMGLPIHQFFRNNTDNPCNRGCALFIRYNVPYWVAKICGTDPYIDGDTASMSFNGYAVSGFRNYVAQFRSNESWEPPWIRAVNQRQSGQWSMPRSQMGWCRGIFSPTAVDGVPVNVTGSSYNIPAGTRVVPLYTTTAADIDAKSIAIGVVPPDLTRWWFPLFGAAGGSQAINEVAINAGSRVNSSQVLVNNYDLLFFRGSTVGYLSSQIPDVTGWQTYAPSVGEIQTGDYLVGIQIITGVIGVYWVTTDLTNDAKPYWTVNVSDTLNVQYDMPLTRIGGLNGTPFYQLRGRGTLDYNNVNGSINGQVIDGAWVTPPPGVDQQYIDKYNPTNVVINRSGVALVHALEEN